MGSPDSSDLTFRAPLSFPLILSFLVISVHSHAHGITRPSRFTLNLPCLNLVSRESEASASGRKHLVGKSWALLDPKASLLPSALSTQKHPHISTPRPTRAFLLRCFTCHGSQTRNFRWKILKMSHQSFK